MFLFWSINNHVYIFYGLFQKYPFKSTTNTKGTTIIFSPTYLYILIGITPVRSSNETLILKQAFLKQFESPYMFSNSFQCALFEKVSK